MNGRFTILRALLPVLAAMFLSVPFALATEFGPIEKLAIAAMDEMQIEIDARDLTRRLLSAEVSIPVSASETDRRIPLWYPKWVPGSHGPGGPIANLAGFRVKDEAGNNLTWERSGGEVFRFEVNVPKNVNRIRVWLRYITNQPTTDSFGHDSYGSKTIGVISPNTVLCYPEGVKIDEMKISSMVKLPQGWKASAALPSLASENQDQIAYSAVTLRQFVDSPIMCGPYHKTYDLVPESEKGKIPPHRLQVFGETPKATDVHPEIVKRYAAMVTQTARLVGSHPFDQFDILLGVTDSLSPNGLEHARSTFNILPTLAVSSPRELYGWNRLLVPHEYLHAWCGKYRCPEGMATPDFHSPMDTELLWVYEGLTQYLGELVEARCGLMSGQEFRQRFRAELRSAVHQQGRQWRSLADTGAASHLLRDGSKNWPNLRRSQDYYMEGMLFWLEVDGILREETKGAKSLDDFCHLFFRYDPTGPNPRGYNREELVAILNSLAVHDWSGLIHRRIESAQPTFDSEVASRLGYRFALQKDPPVVPRGLFRGSSGIDALDSLGVSFSDDGVIRELMLDSPADVARLAPGMKVISIGSKVFSRSELDQALENAQMGGEIELNTVDGDAFLTIKIPYREGRRHWALSRDEGKPDLLAEILKPR
jgi:predicted metalloprotease with PDZ domain